MTPSTCTVCGVACPIGIDCSVVLTRRLTKRWRECFRCWLAERRNDL